MTRPSYSPSRYRGLKFFGIAPLKEPRSLNVQARDTKTYVHCLACGERVDYAGAPCMRQHTAYQLQRYVITGGMTYAPGA